MRTAVGVVRLLVYVSVAGPLLAYLQLVEKRKRYRSQGAYEPHDDIPQHQNEGVGPEETARLKELFRVGKLLEHCTRVLDVPTKKARALIARRHHDR
jgi:hypothetical protein